MTYWALNAVFLAVVLAVGVAGAVRVVTRARRRPGHPEAARRTAGAFGVALAVLLVTTAVFDNVMIRVGLVGYDPALISGAFIGVAPLEDFAYAVAAAVLLPSLWLLLERRERS